MRVTVCICVIECVCVSVTQVVGECVYVCTGRG